MVVLMEELSGLSLKRKGADDPELFDHQSGFPLSCRATKMRRLACPDGGQHCRQDGPAVSGGVGVQGQADLPMDDAAPSPSARAATDEEKAVVQYGVPSDNAWNAPRLRPCGSHVRVRAGADWVVRAMLREADSRTVRELLVGAKEQGDDLALAVVPWVPAPAAAEEPAEPSVAEEAVDDGDGAAAMDVEEEEEYWARHWTTLETMAFGGAGAGCGEGFVYRWPQQHCMEPPQLPVVGQTSPVMWSW